MSKLDFQPMPKRFMVYDIPNEQFLTICDAYPKCRLSEDERKNTIFPMEDLVALFREMLCYDRSNDYIVCQSTNLFDKDGKEIFEGSIVEDTYSGLRWLVFIENSEVMIRRGGAVNHYGYISTGNKKNVEVNVKSVGHILSDPELLEEKG